MPGRIEFKLGDTLDEIGITRNRVAVESKTRPATILDLVAGDTKTIKLETLVSVLDAVNSMAAEKGMRRVYGIEDVVKYIPE